MEPMSSEFRWISEKQKDRFAKIYHVLLELFPGLKFVDIVDSDLHEVLTFELADGRKLKISANDTKVDGAYLDIELK